jgi:hypothetical protein
MELLDRLRALTPVLAEQGRLIRLAESRRVIYVGDTHGDLDATETVLRRYARDDTAVVFLGDAVDRGPHSEANLRRIVEAKLDDPEAVFLVMGNHEGWSVTPIFPADFWTSLAPREAAEIGTRLLALPLAVWHPAGILALHGALPDVDGLDAIEAVDPSTEAWRRMTWGDYATSAGEGSPFLDRPMFGRGEFERLRAALGIRILVRAHQPSAPLWMFDRRCLTLFTSSAYGRGDRVVAVLEQGASTLEVRAI